jgi:hypothetical protein
VRVVIFYADAHERDLANILSASLTGRQDAKRVASGAPANRAFRSPIRPLAWVARRIWPATDILAMRALGLDSAKPLILGKRGRTP